MTKIENKLSVRHADFAVASNNNKREHAREHFGCKLYARSIACMRRI